MDWLISISIFWIILFVLTWLGGKAYYGGFGCKTKFEPPKIKQWKDYGKQIK